VSPPTEVPDHTAAATQAAGRPVGKWGGRIATATALYHLGKQAQQQYRNWQGARTFTVTVHEGDEVYDHVHEWLLAKLPDEAQRALTATTRTYRGDEPHKLDGTAPVADAESETIRRRVVLAYDGARRHEVELDGHTIVVQIEKDESTYASRPGRDPEGRASFMYPPHRVIFTARTLDGRAAVVAFLQGIADSLVSGKRVPRLVIASRWGHWGPRRPLPIRSLDSVVLPAGHLDGLVADLARFLASEDKYGLLGVPWHRGYLLHGPPGTGKTSALRAVAGHFGLDVYALSLSDLGADANLNDLLANVPERSLLLLEDIDVVHAAKTRDDSEREGITLAGLLNALDGMVTPHGLVIGMTTNRRDVLDEALLRDGRVDEELEMGPLTPDQFERLVAQLTGRRLQLSGAGPVWPEVTAGEIVGCVMRNLDDMDAAGQAAVDLLTERWTAAATVDTHPRLAVAGSLRS